MKALFKAIDYRHYICMGITIGFVLISVYLFPYAFVRIMEGFRDVGLSLAYFFTELLGFNGVIVPSVTAYSKAPLTMFGNFPATWKDFKLDWASYWQTFANGQNFLGYLGSIGKGALVFSYVSTLIVPIIIILFVVIQHFMLRQNNRYNEDTKPLKAFKKLSDYTYRPVKACIASFLEFIKVYRLYYLLWVFIWLYSFNFFTVLLEVFAYYYYFVVSFDVASIYPQVVKLLLDLSVMIKFVPVSVWIIVGLIIFDKFRKRIGYDILIRHELINRGFINGRGVFTLFVAPMRQGKTKLSTSIALSREVMLRDMAYEIILKCDLKFPFFPWINLENSLRNAMDTGAVLNLVTCRRFVHSKMCKFFKHRKKQFIFGYDFERYGMEYNNGMYIEKLEDVLSNYVQAYFIYVIQSSLIVSNFSIRVDNIIEDVGNFPIWNSDFFKTDSRLIESHSRHSHIISYDSIRLGKKLIGESKFAFEFGVIDITEIAKERLNMLELMGVKKEDKETNQRNDGFEDWVKMCGHSATVDFKCFISIYADDQREDNLGAGLREVGEIVRIEDVEKNKLAMPGFFLGELIYGISHKLIAWLHKKVRYNMGNNTLPYYIIHTVISKMECYYNRIYNTFGYELMYVSVQDGAKNKEQKLHKYYISNKKDLSKRYSTDCLSDTLAVRALRATWGLDDLPVYKTERASHDENMQQESFFIRSITKYVGGVSDKNKELKKAEIDENKLKRLFEGKRW